MNYSFNSRVRYSETGENGKLTLPGVLNYFQDCCTFHAESVGLGGDVLKARDRAWVLSSWQVIVDEYPAMGTEIRITTAPYDFKGFMGMRNFTIETMDGKKLAWANSNWTHLAISTGIQMCIRDSSMAGKIRCISCFSVNLDPIWNTIYINCFRCKTVYGSMPSIK